MITTINGIEYVSKEWLGNGLNRFQLIGEWSLLLSENVAVGVTYRATLKDTQGITRATKSGFRKSISALAWAIKEQRKLNK